MKNIWKNWLLAVICIAAFGACDDDDNVTPAPASLSIENAPAKAEFEIGATQIWTIKSENVVSISVKCPQGWSADCTQKELSVTAPAKDATAFDEEGNVTITYSGQDGKKQNQSLAVCLKKDPVPAEEASLTIENAPQKAEFKAGDTQIWTVKAEHVESISVTSPKGWSADCTQKELSVTAPAKDATAFDEEGNVTITYSGKDGMEKQTSLAVCLQAEPEPEPDLTFELTLTDLTSSSVVLNVSPSDKSMPYYYDIAAASAFAEYNNDAGTLVENIINTFLAQHPEMPLEVVMEGLLEYGDSSDTVQNLPCDTDMVFFAVGIDKQGKAYGTAGVKPFHTPAPGKPEDCTFKIEFEKLRASSVDIKVTPSDSGIRYWLGIEEVSKWQGDSAIPVSVKETLDQVAQNKGKTIEEVVEAVTFVGAQVDPWDSLEPDKTYYAYVYAMDPQGNPAGEIFKERFKTASYDISDAELNLIYRYFDGDMLHEKDPRQFAKAQGKVLVQVKANPNLFASSWVIALGKGDMTDPEIYPDVTTKNAILQGGQLNRDISQFWVDGWNVCTLFGCAFDETGIDGKLSRILLDLKKETSAPFEELAPVTQPANRNLLQIAPDKEREECPIRVKARRKTAFSRASKILF